MAIEQPQPSDILNNPSHSNMHRIFAADLGASAQSISVDSDDNVTFLGDLIFGVSTLGTRSLAVGTGGVFNIAIGSAAGDDFTVDTDKLVVEGDTGNVGIGTTSPGYKLDIVSPASEARNAIMKGSTADDANSAFYIANGTLTAGEFRPGFIGIKSADANSPLTFYGRINPTYDTGTNALVRFVAQTWTGDDLDGTSGAPVVRPLFQFIGSGIIGNVMTVAANGNVGIGTSAPDTKLDVAGAITHAELSADPSDPDEGKTVMWTSDGTGTGDDGDVMMKITAGGVTKTVTLVDFSLL